MANMVLIVLAVSFVVNAQGADSTSIILTTPLGGDVTLKIGGATSSQCSTYSGIRLVECTNRTKIEGVEQQFQGRVSGVCNSIKLERVRKEDQEHRFVCRDLQSKSEFIYQIKVISAPPQNVSISAPPQNVSVSEDTVSWLPTGDIREYKVRLFQEGNINEPINEITVTGTSIVLEGLLPNVTYLVSVAVVTSATPSLGNWSKLQIVFKHPTPTGQKESKGPVNQLAEIILIVVITVVALIALLLRCGLLEKIWGCPKDCILGVDKPTSTELAGINLEEIVQSTEGGDS